MCWYLLVTIYISSSSVSSVSSVSSSVSSVSSSSSSSSVYINYNVNKNNFLQTS
nr:MAG TPA: LIPID-PROTEIN INTERACTIONS IN LIPOVITELLIN, VITELLOGENIN, LIPOPROTEIN, PLASMA APOLIPOPROTE [Caudoviricetes sp.]